MAHPTPTYATLDDGIASHAIPFFLDSSSVFGTAVDKVVASLGDSVELLGLAEALHGGEDILILRNRLFQYLVEAHGYSAIAIESSFPRGHLVNEYLAGRGPTSYEVVQDSGFSHGFGRSRCQSRTGGVDATLQCRLLRPHASKSYRLRLAGCPRLYDV